MKLARKEEPQTRLYAIYALGRIGARKEQVLSFLVDRLDHESFHVQYIACQSLAFLGTSAESAIRSRREGVTTASAQSR